MMTRGSWSHAMDDRPLLVVDRLEGEFAVLEYGGRTFTIPRRLLPGDAKEGDVLRLAITVDKGETTKRRRRVQELVDELFD